MANFPLNPPEDHLKIDLKSVDLEEAKGITTFPLRHPASLPPGLRLTSFDQFWPPHIDAERRQGKVHADYVVANYVNSDGATVLQIFQGFFAWYFPYTRLEPPSESTGSIQIQEKDGRWLTALPDFEKAELRTENGREYVTAWIDKGDFAYLGWKDGVHLAPNGGRGDSPRFYELASVALTVPDLTVIGESVPVTPFITTP